MAKEFTKKSLHNMVLDNVAMMHRRKREHFYSVFNYSQNEINEVENRRIEILKREVTDAERPAEEAREDVKE